MAKPATITAEQRKRFLENLADTRNVTVSARAAGIKRRAALDLRARDADFAADWADAEEEATDLLEHEARQRALKGVEEPVFYHGTKAGTLRRYSDELILLFLRAERPEKFADKPADKSKGDREAWDEAAGGVLVVPGDVEPETWSEQVKDHQRKLANGSGT